MRAYGTHPTHKPRNRRSTVGCVAQATHAFGGWNGLCRLRWLNADSVRDVRDACVRLRRLWAANRTYGGYGGYVEQGVYPQDWAGIIEEGDFGE